jgi:hypothetical protein
MTGCSDDDNGSGNFAYVEDYCARWHECDPEGAPFDSVNQCVSSMQYSLSVEVEQSGPACGDAYEDFMQCFSQCTCAEINSGIVCPTELTAVSQNCEQSPD